MKNTNPHPDPNISNPESKHYNKDFYSPEYDDENVNQMIQHYTSEAPDQLDYTDVWDHSYLNLICPEYFYHPWFGGVLYTAEPEVLWFLYQAAVDIDVFVLVDNQLSI